jgi:hypothetical protein
MGDVKMNIKKLFSIFILMLFTLPFAFAEEVELEDSEIFGFEVEKLLFFVSANLALVLAVLTFIAYNRTKKSKLAYVVFAFSLFSAKLFLKSSELFFEEAGWIDPVAAVLDLAILLSFFLGIIKK